MTAHEAKEILLLFRPGTRDEQNPEFREALDLASTDPELRVWFADHCALQKSVADALRNISPPVDLKQRIILARKIERGVQWRPQKFPLMAAAAALTFLIGIALFWSGFSSEDHFKVFRSRMVSTALREYRMDLTTNELAEVRRFMQTKGAPDDFAVPEGLKQVELAGGGFLKWRDRPVSMVCFRRPDQQMLYLFVIRSNALPDPPRSDPKQTIVHDLNAVSWSSGNNTYVLAGPEEAGFMEKYIKP